MDFNILHNFFYISCLLRCFSTQKKRKVQFSFWLGMHYSCVQCRMSYICVVVPLGYVYMSIYEFTYRYVYLFFYISVCLYLSIYLQKYRYVDRQTQRQIVRQTDRHRGRQLDNTQTDRYKERQIEGLLQTFFYLRAHKARHQACSRGHLIYDLWVFQSGFFF